MYTLHAISSNFRFEGLMIIVFLTYHIIFLLFVICLPTPTSKSSATPRFAKVGWANESSSLNSFSIPQNKLNVNSNKTSEKILNTLIQKFNFFEQ